MVGLVSFGSGALLASGVWTAFPRRAAPEVKKDDTTTTQAGDDDLRKANENLTESLHACDRQLAELRARSGEPAPVASVAQPRAEEATGRTRSGRRGGGETTKEDWERMAQLGVVRVRIPCIRDTPWKPSERAVERLALAPDDVKTLEEAYAASNKRVEDQIKPLCAKVVGSADVAEKIGASACIDAIQGSARKTDAKGAKEALSRVAEVQAGKRNGAPGDDAAPIERLASVLATETTAFEADLAKRLGPDDAKRIANDPALCADRRVLRTSDEPVDLRGDDRGGRGRRGN